LHLFCRLIAQCISREHEENAHHSRTMVEETDNWQAEEIGLAAVGGICGSDVVGGVGDVKDKDEEGGDAAHTV